MLPPSVRWAVTYIHTSTLIEAREKGPTHPAYPSMHFVVGTQYSSFAGRVPNDSDELVEGGGPTLVRVSVCRHRAARVPMACLRARSVGRSVGVSRGWVVWRVQAGASS